MTSDLKSKQCQACTADTPKFDQKEITNYLSKIDNWSVNDEQKMIYKKFFFKSFKQSLDFANKVGKISEEEGHHPDISIGWGYALIMTYTHSIKGLSINDFILASKIDNIV
jgi:4a-hydroxytetrahydrobiopterin dehydratase